MHVGRCLLLAAEGRKSALHVVDVSDSSPLKECIQKALENGLRFYSQTLDTPESVDLMSESVTDSYSDSN